MREKRTEKYGSGEGEGEENRGEATDRLIETKLIRDGSYQLHEVK